MNSDQNAFMEQIYLEMFNGMKSYAAANLPCEALAEEAVQETFRIACMKREEFCSSPNPKGWLVQTMKNVIRNTQRTLESANRLYTIYVASKGAELVFSEDRISLDVLYGNISDTEEFRLIKEMAVDGKSHLEIARSRGISVNNCKKRMQRAREKLKKKIKF